MERGFRTTTSFLEKWLQSAENGKPLIVC